MKDRSVFEIGCEMDALAHVVVVSDQDLQECLQHIAEAPVVGLDTEFVGEENYFPELCLIQLATPNALYLVDPLTLGIIETLWRHLADREVVVHAGREEIRLCQRFTGKVPDKWFDLQVAAALVGMSWPIGHGSLVYQVLGQKINKGETLTEWRKRPLTKSQLDYAFDDVRFLLPLHERLHERLRERQRCGWLAEECLRLVQQATQEPEQAALASEKWRRLKGVSSLGRRTLATVREIYLWRERAAIAHNRPARVILRDDLIVEIARRTPKSDKDLKVVRGLAHRFTKDLFQAIEKARDMPLEACPHAAEREQDPPQASILHGLLSAVLADFCAREQLASSLVASTQDLKSLVKAKMMSTPWPDDSLLTRGWRSEFVLPKLADVLEGRTKVSVGDVQSGSPLVW